MESNENEMGLMSKIVGIFSNPRSVFESFDANPSWLVPFIIIVVVFVATQLMVMDIGIADRIALMETQDIPAERLDLAKQQMSGPLKYVGLIVGPIFILIMWAVIAGVIFLISNMTLGGDTTFKKVYSVIAWTGLVGTVGMLLISFLVLSKGTAYGVGLDLSVIMNTPPLGEDPSFIYQLLSKIDIFVLWELALWTIGLSVLYKKAVEKAVIPVAIVWGAWIVISISLGGFFRSLGM